MHFNKSISGKCPVFCKFLISLEIAEEKKKESIIWKFKEWLLNG